MNHTCKKCGMSNVTIVEYERKCLSCGYNQQETYTFTPPDDEKKEKEKR